MVITWKTRNIIYLFPLLKIKAVINRVLTIKGIVLVVHATLVKLNVMQKLDGINIIIQVKVQNHQNTFESTSTTFLRGLSFQVHQKMLIRRHHILLTRNLILTRKWTVKDKFYFKMV